MFSVPVGGGEIMTDRTLAIHAGVERRPLEGIDTREPTYGLPAMWIGDTLRT
jgi:flagellar biosynthesis protein FlhA